jgi:uncharacterized membrane protein
MASASTTVRTGHAAPGAARGTPTVRRIGFDALGTALKLGWQDFLAVPTQLIFLGLIYPLVGVFAWVAIVGGDLAGLFYPLVAGLSLLGPVLALGMYEISKRREEGRPAHMMCAFQAFRSPAIGRIFGLGVVLLGIFVAWIFAARLILETSIGSVGGESVTGFVARVFETRQGWQLLLLGNLVGAGFAALVLALTVVSFPMLLDRNTSLGTAVGTSVRAVLQNPAPMAAWGLIVAALLVLGSIPAFIGLAVVMPLLGHSTWHLYRQVVE